MEPKELEKLGAAAQMAQPVNAHQVRQLAENLELFDFVPKIKTPEEYGKYLIQESGHFDFDENLEDYYNYERYGQDQMSSEKISFMLTLEIGAVMTCKENFLRSLELCRQATEKDRLRIGGIST